MNFEHSSDLGIFALLSPHSVLFLSHTRTIYFDSPKAFGERNSCPQPRPFRICLRVFSGDRADRKLFRITFHQCRRRLQAYILNRRPPESGSTAHLQLWTTCYNFTTPWTSSPFPRPGTCSCNTNLLSHFMLATFSPILTSVSCVHLFSATSFHYSSLSPVLSLGLQFSECGSSQALEYAGH